VVTAVLTDVVTGAQRQVDIPITLLNSEVPIVTSVTPSSVTPTDGDVVQYVAQASDANGDILDYCWQFGEPP
jgi:hypothetical protein